MATRKNDIEQENAKKANPEPDDLYDDEIDTGEVIDNIDFSSNVGNGHTARKRLEEYLEEKRLRQSLEDDDLLDFD